MLQRLVVDPTQIHPPWIALSDPQQHYLRRVLRLNVGDRILVLDGQGHQWLAEMTNSTQVKLLDVLLPSQTESPIAVTLVCALPKGNAFDEVIRQCTELGVAAIQPVISDRTLLHPSPQKCDRWRRIAQEATEQCERTIVPTLQDPLPLREWLQRSDSEGIQYVCAERQDAPHLFACLQQTLNLKGSITAITVAIGPEGGWTAAEIEAFEHAHYPCVSLGPRILRAVTAPVMVMAWVAALGDAGILKSE